VDASARAYLHAVNKALHLSKSLEQASEAALPAQVPRVAEAAVAPRPQAAPGVPPGSPAELRQAQGGIAPGPVGGTGSDKFVRLINLV